MKPRRPHVQNTFDIYLEVKRSLFPLPAFIIALHFKQPVRLFVSKKTTNRRRSTPPITGLVQCSSLFSIYSSGSAPIFLLARSPTLISSSTSVFSPRWQRLFPSPSQDVSSCPLAALSDDAYATANTAPSLKQKLSPRTALHG